MANSSPPGCTEKKFHPAGFSETNSFFWPDEEEVSSVIVLEIQSAESKFFIVWVRWFTFHRNYSFLPKFHVSRNKVKPLYIANLFVARTLRASYSSARDHLTNRIIIYLYICCDKLFFIIVSPTVRNLLL